MKKGIIVMIMINTVTVHPVQEMKLNPLYISPLPTTLQSGNHLNFFIVEKYLRPINIKQLTKVKQKVGTKL